MILNKNTQLKHGEYVIIDSLGQGGFGITYLAEQVSLKRKVAIKEFFLRDFCNRDSYTLRVSSTGSTDVVGRFRDKFLKEAYTIAGLDHPNIVRIIDVFEENDTAYYVMEYHSGYSLGSVVDKQGAMSEEQALRYIRQVASALKYIHSRRMMHLDIKPDNILLNSRGEAVLIDFGISKVFEDEIDNVKRPRTSTIAAYSPGFAPKEQYNPKGVTEFSPATDIYSLGATLFTLLIGECPPPAIELDESDYIITALKRSNISKRLSAAVIKAMAYTKKDRPQSVDEFLSLLDAVPQSVSRIAPQPASQVLPQPASQVAPQPVSQVAPQPASQVAPQPASQVNSQPKKPFNWKPLVGIIAAILCIVFAGVGINECNDYRAEQKRAAIEKYYNDGVKAYNTGNYSEAVKWYRKAAEQGFALAQCFLGVCYEKGQGVPQNYTEAVKWYRKAAEQGNARAQNNLGVCYEKGQGVPQNYTEAVKWYRKAAEQGNAIAQNNLGVCYYNGEGVPKNYSEAVKWYRKAAEQGNAQAQFNLGYCYYHGEGVPQNYTEAVKWYRKAAEQGEAAAQYNLGYCYYSVPKNYSEAVKWYRKAAEQGFALAQCFLGVCYEKGQGVAKNYTEAVKWYRKAAEQGEVTAQCNLGYCYENGIGVPKNYSEALKWYRKAAEQGYENAKAALQRLGK